MTYYLEFFDDGQMLYISNELIVEGIYEFIGDEYIEIVWGILIGTLVWEVFGGHGVDEVKIYGDKMMLK